MVASTARPEVRRGDVSEEPRRWLLVAVLVVALVPTASADCAGSGDTRCYCSRYVNEMTCALKGGQVPSFRASHKYDIVTIRSLNSSLSVTIHAEAFKNLHTKSLDILSYGNITVITGVFSSVDGQLGKLRIGRTLRTIPDEIFHGLDQLRSLDLSDNLLKTVSRAMFAPMAHLETLILSGNQIETITV